MQSLNDVWKMTLSEMKKEFSETAMNLWFNDLTLVSIDDNVAKLLCETNFKRDMIDERHHESIAGYLSRTLGFDVDIAIYSKESGGIPEDGQPPRKSDEKNPASTGAENSQPGNMPPENISSDNISAETGDGEDDGEEPEFYSSVGGVKVRNFASSSPFAQHKNEYTFENFIVGNSNKFAHAACTAVADMPGKSYNPLFIHGPSGLGKTHLLYAITNSVQKKYPEANIIYVKGEEFTNQMIESISRNFTRQFREKYRRADVLLIDDIQFIAGREATQEEFFHTFNALYEDQKQIIMTSDRPPRDIKTLEDRLKTRFEWGLIADIQPPDYELRIAIMQNKAKLLNLNIPIEVYRFLADSLRSNVRQLEGAVKKIGAQSFLNSEPITVEFATRCISDLIGGGQPVTVTVDKILSGVAKKYGISVADLKSRKRTRDIAFPRHVAIYIIRKMTDMSLPMIGREFGRDHTTVMSSLDAIDSEIKSNSLLEIEIAELMKEIRES